MSTYLYNIIRNTILKYETSQKKKLQHMNILLFLILMNNQCWSVGQTIYIGIWYILYIYDIIVKSAHVCVYQISKSLEFP